MYKVQGAAIYKKNLEKSMYLISYDSIKDFFVRTMFLLTLRLMDPCLARLDYASLSDQALMEMFVEPMIEEENGLLTYGRRFSTLNMIDVCEWNCIECEDGRVTKVQFLGFNYSKKRVPFEFIPPLVREFDFSESQVHGTLDTSHLPENLEEFNIYTNEMEGSLNFKEFPRMLRVIDISENCFSGSCALSDLPDTLIDLIAHQNKFSGKIMLDALPIALRCLILSKNLLEGPIHIETLPKNIESIDFSENAFSGRLRMMSFPSSLEKINLEKNALDGTAFLLNTGKKRHLWILNENFTMILDEKGNVHPWQAEILERNFFRASSEEDSKEDSSYSPFS